MLITINSHWAGIKSKYLCNVLLCMVFFFPLLYLEFFFSFPINYYLHVHTAM